MISPELTEAIAAAGLFRLLKPVRFGGYPVAMRTMLEITQALGEADGSTAWLVSIHANSAWLTAHAPERALEDIFGVDADARIAGSNNRIIPAERVDGGLLISGSWPYASGALHASWAGVCVSTGDTDGGPTDPRCCWVPADEMQVENTWQTVGMRGTGSHSWVAQDVFVPDYRQMSLSELIAASATSTEPLYRLPFGGVAAVGMLGPLLGMGNAALRLAIEGAGSKKLQHSAIARQCDSVGVQIEIADAALQLRTARLHACEIADQLDDAVLNETELSDDDRALIRAQSGYAARQIIDAINTCLNVHGAGSFAETNKLQQYWRDAATVARHAGFNGVIGYEILGKSLLGLSDQIPFLY